MTATPPNAAELEHAALCVERQANAAAVAVFAHDVVTSWADGRSLFSGQQFMTERAARYGVNHANAATELGNVLIMLERGARASAEVALISAFAAHGFDAVFEIADSSESEHVANRFVTQLDWLETATDFRVTAFLERLMGEPARRALLAALGRAVLRDDASDDAADVGVRARNAARITVLARSHNEVAQSALVTLRREAKDPVLRALAAALTTGEVPDVPEATPTFRLSGVARTPSRSLPIALLRWLSGFALLQAVHRFFCYLVAMRRELDLELRGDALKVRSRTLFMGRTLRSTEACYEVRRVTGAFRRARFALLRTVVGVLSLALGVLIGGYLVFDGARGGAPWLLLLGAGTVALGSAVDLVLTVLIPARQARVDVQVDLRDARSLRLGHVAQADADRLVQALSLRLAR